MDILKCQRGKILRVVALGQGAEIPGSPTHLLIAERERLVTQARHHSTAQQADPAGGGTVNPDRLAGERPGNRSFCVTGQKPPRPPQLEMRRTSLLPAEVGKSSLLGSSGVCSWPWYWRGFE